MLQSRSCYLYSNVICTVPWTCFYSMGVTKFIIAEVGFQIWPEARVAWILENYTRMWHLLWLQTRLWVLSSSRMWSSFLSGLLAGLLCHACHRRNSAATKVTVYKLSVKSNIGNERLEKQCWTRAPGQCTFLYVITKTHPVPTRGYPHLEMPKHRLVKFQVVFSKSIGILISSWYWPCNVAAMY